MGHWSQKSRCFYSVWVREGLGDPGDAKMFQDTSYEDRQSQLDFQKVAFSHDIWLHSKDK